MAAAGYLPQAKGVPCVDEDALRLQIQELKIRSKKMQVTASKPTIASFMKVTLA